MNNSTKIFCVLSALTMLAACGDEMESDVAFDESLSQEALTSCANLEYDCDRHGGSFDSTATLKNGLYTVVGGCEWPNGQHSDCFNRTNLN